MAEVAVADARYIWRALGFSRRGNCDADTYFVLALIEFLLIPRVCLRVQLAFVARVYFFFDSVYSCVRRLCAIRLSSCRLCHTLALVDFPVPGTCYRYIVVSPKWNVFSLSYFCRKLCRTKRVLFYLICFSRRFSSKTNLLGLKAWLVGHAPYPTRHRNRYYVLRRIGLASNAQHACWYVSRIARCKQRIYGMFPSCGNR